jgi:hypothetical protein
MNPLSDVRMALSMMGIGGFMAVGIFLTGFIFFAKKIYYR